jgi:hypothetical protein
MAQFNLNDYETVEERLKRLYEKYPDARVITTNLTTPQDRQVSTWVVKAEIYLPIWTLDAALEKAGVEYKQGYERDCWFLKATGHAFEVDGVNGMANKTSALENCETSAIGRALANMNLSGNKRTSREEMEKVARDVTPKPAPARNWANEVIAVVDVDSARKLYLAAQKAKAPQQVLDAITAKAKTLGSGN